MERRKELRLAPGQPMQATVLGGGRPPLAADVIDVSTRGVSLRLPSAIEPGTLIQVEMPDALLLGETCYCHPDGNGYRAGVLVKHALRDLSQLHTLSERIRTEGAHAAWTAAADADALR